MAVLPIGAAPAPSHVVFTQVDVHEDVLGSPTPAICDDKLCRAAIPVDFGSGRGRPIVHAMVALPRMGRSVLIALTFDSHEAILEQRRRVMISGCIANVLLSASTPAARRSKQ